MKTLIMMKQNHIDFCQLYSAADCDVKALLFWLTREVD